MVLRRSKERNVAKRGRGEGWRKTREGVGRANVTDACISSCIRERETDQGRSWGYGPTTGTMFLRILNECRSRRKLIFCDPWFL